MEYEILAANDPADEDREEALVEGLREQSSEACTAFYRRFAPAIHRFAIIRLGGDGECAEDIVARTCVDAVRNINKFHRKSSLKAWLYGIARRHVIGAIRKKKRLKSIPPGAETSMEAVAEISDGQDLASRASARLDAQRQFAALAEALSDLEMEALILQSVDEFSLREIGNILGRSERAVHSLLRRAKQKARERLAQDER
ncbi:MAG: sigma-70 family RNA polymerase sigma factor [Armatimonadetes bacterium]|nr:sigma-70 family RNA polymerase sigma factor [Armatimonadota bacterium]NIM24006.1 sigma-70 family RNA polymerase sigma factor [Armatimonadota bacterium]NIM67856.1 sigma-70 family RNA polymerase sigma factor [Armatimonadota bacterium]NIM76387.1 sigma-70 family RNA polymerase sigma factor [Armatimonadota bacterium]NIN06086.1 sigma-70 family RNA polymerase sigma factor [Armatimonadota bacterium]